MLAGVLGHPLRSLRLRVPFAQRRGGLLAEADAAIFADGGRDFGWVEGV